MTTQPYELHFPPDYATEEWIWSSKGFVVVEVEVALPVPRRYSLTFRDPTRLVQDLEADLAEGRFFSEPNLVVVTTVDRKSIQHAVDELASQGFAGLIPE